MSYKEKLKDIKAFVFDIDGVFTDGSVYLLPGGNMCRVMNVLDGYAVVKAIKNNYKIGVITGGNDDQVRHRINYLGISDYYAKSSNKRIDFEDFKSKYNLKNEEILMMGDDLPDMEIMKMAGISACPKNSVPEVKEISDYIGVPLGKSLCGRFNNGEIQVMINESVRGKDCFIIQPTGSPVNDNLMEMLIMVDALKRASARNITVVVPYYGYARQDRKTRGREPISAKLVADLLGTAGVTRVVTMDLHAGQIQGFFDVPVDHLASAALLADYVKSKNLENLTVVSPDLGGVNRARDLADRVGAPIAIIEKRRPEPGVAKVMNIIGDVKGRNCFVVDDIVDTAGSLCEGAKALMEYGAAGVYAAVCHPVLTDPATERIKESVLKELVVTNSLPIEKEKMQDKLTVLSVAPLLGEAILRIFHDASVSALFDK